MQHPPQSATLGAPRHRRRVLALIVLVVAIEAAVLLPQVPATGAMGGDAREYDALARNLVERHCFSATPDCRAEMLRTPGYPLFLAAVYEFGGGVRAVRMVQFGALALTAFLVFETAAVHFSGAAPLLAALLSATFLPLVLAPLYHMPETLATAAAAATVWAASKLPGWRWAIAFGAFSGIGYLVRPTLALLPLGLGVAALAMRRATLRQMMLAALACIAALTPLVVQNSLAEHRLALVGSPPGWSVYISALQWQRQAPYRLTAAPFLALTQERQHRISELQKATGVPLDQATAEVDRQYLRQGLDEYRRIPITRLAVGWPQRMFQFWGADDSGLGLPYVFLVEPAQWLLVAVLALLGMWRERRRALQLALLWTPLVCLSLFHTFFHVEPRYAQMGWPFLAIFAAAGVQLAARRFEWRGRVKANAASGATP